MTAKTTIFNPVDMPLRGSISVPGDKSIASRAIFLAAIANGTSHIYDVPNSLDVMTVAKAVEDLGATVKITPSKFSNSRNVDLEITGWGADGPRPKVDVIDCGNSATCARVLMGLLATRDINIVIDGDESLHRRPFMRIVDPLMQMGAHFKVVAQKNGRPQRSTLPLEVVGTSDSVPIFYEMPVASSQVKTSILFAGSNIDGQTTVIEPYTSRNHGELLLKSFGADIEFDTDSNTISITGKSNIHSCDLHVPGDVSSAAYYLTAASLVPGSRITIKNVGINETRLGFVRALKKMGSRIEVVPKNPEELQAHGVDYGFEPVGDITVEYSGRLKNITVDANEIPQMVDEIPVLAMAAACASGESIFYGVTELRLKESNRNFTIVEGLRKLGCRAIDRGDVLYVEGGIDIEAKKTKKPVKDDIVKLNHHSDHRLAIVWALMGLCGYIPTELKNFEISHVSYPQFLEDFEKLIVDNT